MSPADELKRATAVFVGEVHSTTTDGQSVSVEFNIDRLWKGVQKQIIVLTTSRYDSDCGIEFRTGVKYIVYAFGKDLLTVSRCNRTKEASKAKQDLEELGEGKKP